MPPPKRRQRSSGELCLAAALLVTAAAPLRAQDSTARPSHSSKPQIEFGGTVLLNGFYTSARTNNSDVPQFVLPPAADGLPDRGLGGTIRQSRFRLFLFWPELGGAEARAEVDVDFFGGQQPSTGGRTFPLPRMRRAFARLAWPNVELLAGQESPPIADISPSSLASIGFPEFAGAGNLWLWLPQVRVTALTRAGGAARIGAEVAVLAPTSGDPQTSFTTEPDRAERSGRPYLQGRVLARWGSGPAAGELSVGGHLGWLAVSETGVVQSRALAASARIPLGPHLELLAEAFTGRALAGLGGGGIGQSLGPGSVPVRTRGGWTQLNIRPATTWETGFGIGIDDPNDADLDPMTARLRNLTWSGHALWRPAPFVVAAEYRRHKTRYGPALGDLTADVVNVALGFEF